MEQTAEVIYFTAPQQVEVRSEELTPPAEGEERFVSLLQAISPGTERLMYRGDFPRGLEADPAMDGFSGIFDYPFRYGYINVCRNADGRRYFAFRDHTTAFNATPAELIPLPDWLDDREALLLPHTETALSIIHDLEPRLGERILIIGAGILGSLTALLLARFQGCRVTVTDPHQQKAVWFDDLGEALYPVRFVAADTVTADTPNAGWGEFDAAVDCSGSEAGLQHAIDAVGMEGRIGAASWFGDRKVSLNLGRSFHRKRLRLISSQVSNLGYRLGPLWSKQRRMELAMEILRITSPLQLISHSFSFSRASEAYNLIARTDESFGLIALEPQSAPEAQ